ncbi:MAG: hypothetical protein IJV24_04200 [Prevotella sp.]|nr:hypothetical protein [Prevotella sp.]
MINDANIQKNGEPAKKKEKKNSHRQIQTDLQNCCPLNKTTTLPEGKLPTDPAATPHTATGFSAIPADGRKEFRPLSAQFWPELRG